MTVDARRGPVPHLTVENSHKCSFSFMCSRYCDGHTPDETDDVACMYAVPPEPGAPPECNSVDAKIAVLRLVIETAQRQLAALENETEAKSGEEGAA